MLRILQVTGLDTVFTVISRDECLCYAPMILPGGGKFSAKGPVGIDPVALVFDGTDMWAANRDDDTVQEVGQATQRA